MKLACQAELSAAFLVPCPSGATQDIKLHLIRAIQPRIVEIRELWHEAQPHRLYDCDAKTLDGSFASR